MKAKGRNVWQSVVVLTYDIAALLARFDERVVGETGLTGKLSSLLGESLLLSALVHYLRAIEGHEVAKLHERPHRDNAEFQGESHRRPDVRDLDAWLLLDGSQLAAVECKHWTSSSRDYSSVPHDAESLSAHARSEWDWLVSEYFAPDVSGWTQENKVALPLKPPLSLPSAKTIDARRILAIWTPISKDGRSCTSSVTKQTVNGGEPVDIEVEVFSASLYLRSLLDAGVTRFESGDEDMEKLLAALSAVVQATTAP